MIEIGDTEAAVPADVLQAPGGFLWWYVDLVTPEGDGAVLIWAYGLPFLPGYAGAARRGAPQRPADRPSVNLVVYRRGVAVFYLLQEHPAAPVDASARGAAQRIGDCAFTRRVEGSRCIVEAAIDCAVPGTAHRLTGTLRIDGAARSSSPGEASGDDWLHVWTPFTGPAEGEVWLQLGGRQLARFRGRAYHDRNAGRVPLHALGIRRWMWGRLPFAEHERIYYLLWPADPAASPTCLGMEIDASGEARRLELTAELGRERRSFGGLRRPGEIVLREGGRPWLTVRHRRVADAGPFYLRLLSDAEAADGERAVGWGEICVPGRVDLPAHRPFVRMRVHRTDGPNSPWLPLFTGPRRGRAARLVRSLLPGGRGR